MEVSRAIESEQKRGVSEGESMEDSLVVMGGSLCCVECSGVPLLGWRRRSRPAGHVELFPWAVQSNASRHVTEVNGVGA